MAHWYQGVSLFKPPAGTSTALVYIFVWMDGVNLAFLSLCGSNPRAVAFCCRPLSLFVESGFDDCMGGSGEIAVQ